MGCFRTGAGEGPPCNGRTERPLLGYRMEPGWLILVEKAGPVLDAGLFLALRVASGSVLDALTVPQLLSASSLRFRSKDDVIE